ncbi:MAG: hypothetical protein EA370_16950 [Wenzhouxiangella sp.]|nr:MAG: hypothetical protein EA370_16950 [Wenzhouxiangella sp.]
MKASPLINLSRQRGAALFVAIFLITVVVLAAAIVTLTSVTQHTGQARAGQADQAWYAALARLESEIPGILGSGACPAGGSQPIAGLQTTLSCERVEVREGPNTQAVFNLRAEAVLPGTIPVRRTARAQIISGD